jgi:divalent metal cation (Fe/Co/Zn/Cd) transporter
MRHPPNDHDDELESAPSDALRAGARVSLQSIAWTAASSTAAIVIGVASRSLVLIAFGLTGVLDGAASTSLLIHFRHALRHESISERKERAALRMVTAGLVVVGSLTVAESIRRLIRGGQPAPSAAAGLVVAAASTVVLASLAARKRRIARAIPSRALGADGWLSATGALLAVVTVAGTGLASVFGWWWVDPVAAGLVGCGALGVAVATTRH